MKFEAILDEINGFGPFQIILIVLLCSPRMVLPLHFLLGNFIGVAPPHRCDISSLDDGEFFGNLTREQTLIVSIPAKEDGELKSCEMFAEPQFQLLSNSSSSDLPTVQCRSGWIYDNSTLTSTLATEWDLVCDRKHLTKTASSIFFFGVMVGAVAFGFLSDKYGRRNTLLASYIMSMAFGFSAVFSNSFIMFSVLRFFTGFSLTGISITSLVLSIEWVDTDHRSFISVIGGLSWCAGNMLLAAFAFLITDWRLLTVAATAPVALAVLTWWWVPESARWLLANGKVDQAKVYLDKCAKINQRQKATSNVNLEVSCSVMHQETTASNPASIQTLDNIDVGEKQNKNYSYLDLIRTPNLRKLTIQTGIIWYGVASTYYCISLNIAGFGLNIYLTHFIYAAIEVPFKLLVYYAVNYFGRKKCQAGTLMATAAFVAINIFMPKDRWQLRLVFGVLGKGFSEAAFTTIFLYTSELYPTVIRQNGLGYTSFVSRLGVSMAPLILMLEDVWTLLPQIIVSSVALVSGVVALLLPETLNVRLPETIEDAEKPRKIDGASEIKSSGVEMESKSKTVETLFCSEHTSKSRGQHPA